MKNELLIQLQRLLDLFEQCDLRHQGEKLRSLIAAIADQSEGTEAWRISVGTLRENLGGMGSISDVPVYPKAGSALTTSEAAEMLWEIVTNIDALFMDDDGNSGEDS